MSGHLNDEEFKQFNELLHNFRIIGHKYLTISAELRAKALIKACSSLQVAVHCQKFRPNLRH